jgi:hypothetical protein
MKPNQELMILGLGIQLSNFKHGLLECAVLAYRLYNMHWKFGPNLQYLHLCGKIGASFLDQTCKIYIWVGKYALVVVVS